MDVGPIIAIVPVVILVAFIVLLVRRKIVDGSSGMDMRGVIGVLAVVMVAVLLTASIPSSTSSQPYELYDCVPASSFGSVDSVEGSAELVEIGGTEYVRMTGLGTFTVVSGEDSREYKVGKAHMDLVLLTGQSNSVFYTAPEYYQGSSPVAPGKAFYFGTETGSGTRAGLAAEDTLSVSGICDMVSDDGGVRVSQMYPAFCSSYVEETGNRVLVVNTGIGGKGIANWDVGGQCDVWMRDVLRTLSMVLSETGVEVSPTVALWSQGEFDAQGSAGYYIQHFVPLLDRILGGDYGFAFQFMTSCLPRSTTSTYEDMIPPAVAQLAVARVEEPAFTVASSLPCRFTADQTRDGVHYTQEAYGWLGEAFGRQCAVLLSDAPVAETIVLAEDLGDVQTLPAKVECYGTSGAAFELTASWTDEGGGHWTASLSGNPRGTEIQDGLRAQANLT